MAEKKTKKSKESKELFAEFPNLYKNISKDDLAACMDYAEEYKAFLDISKTEREFVENAIEAASDLGFVDIESKKTLKAGDKVYASIKDKGLILAVIGKKPVADGINILGAHIDSPRLDLKPNPVYEDAEAAYFKTHYYGGIKKYQWTTIPLAIHGVIFTKDGTKHKITIGEKDEDPIFYITDLLPHLGNEQMKKNASEFISGEDLNVVIGGMPLKDAEKEPYKAYVLKYLNDNYGIVEKDFVTGEIEIVPAMKARDLGFDRAFIAAYGHDDKVCAYPALTALLEQERPEKTCVTMLTDKEEIGSYANSGAQSVLYENFLMELLAKNNKGNFDLLAYRKAIAASKMLSTDVSNAFDPKYSSVSDSRNTAYMSKGIKLEKYVGARGKSGTNEATGDFVAEIINVFDKNSIPWQTGELGKVDAGGGGTISAYMAKHGMNVIDAGVPVWSMHAPYEVISKIDLYYTYLAYKAFIENI
ncbi:Aspartyl aminopeptidase [Ruminococcaceae bacterium KH2T8]|nr:Aspartyl aminopeptidase [Ruminococcaceae bacterium KH2T8]